MPALPCRPGRSPGARSRGFGEQTLPTPRPAPPRRGQARGLTADKCATVLATCLPTAPHRP